MQKTDEISLLEILVKTSYLTQITEPENRELHKPVGYGSGFIVDYDGIKFFVTADHNVHFDDYGATEQRTWKDYVVSIFNNYTDPNNFLSTGITPLGGFYYMEQFHLNKPMEMSRPLDVSVCKMKPINFQLPFLTDRVDFTGESIEAGEPKLTINKDCFEEPSLNELYLVFGKIKVDLVDNIRITWENTLKESLQFVDQVGDFLLFNTPHEITDKLEWAGLSGSPIMSDKGRCVGVLCDVLEGSHAIWVMPIERVKMLIEVVIQQERQKEK
jgi:hypothetical protein